MKDHSTQNLLDIAAELNIPNEFIIRSRLFGERVLQVTMKSGASYDAILTKTGRVKKGSVRIAA